MNYFFSAVRSVYLQFRARDRYAEYDRPAAVRRLLKKPANLIQVAANKVVNRNRQFQFDGADLRYFHHYYNNTSLNERTIEVPIMRHFIRPGPRTLEVGNVINHYFPFQHDVVDRYEEYPGVTNLDILQFTAPPYDLIISISTLEHLGWDEPVAERDKPLRAIQHLKALLAPLGTMVVTVSHGENPYLDSVIDEVPCSRHFRYQRFARFVGWREVEHIDPRIRYGSPYPGANAIHVLLFHREPQ
jgi:hypothetical protein